METQQSKIKTNWYRTKIGLSYRIYSHQKENSKRRGHNAPSYSLDEFREWLFSQNNFEYLYNNWKNCNYEKMLSPSVDRIDDYKGYSIDNISLTTWYENKKRGHQDSKNGINNKNNKSVYMIDFNFNKKKYFHSVMEASRRTGIDRAHISSCCNGKRKSAGGYYWEFS